ncbi:MAG: lamin tail domain-containing protein, partial [Verrucomicrobiae bacterium]|nr:lamin tail domain-containing protein [Verrucomicrobiae bacterium]
MNASLILPRILTLLLAISAAPAQASEPIAFWDFNAVPQWAEGTNHPPATLGEGIAGAVGGTSVSLASGDPQGSGGRAWNTSRYPAQGQAGGTGGVRFEVSTVGWTNLQLTFRHRASARASANGRIRVSADGAHFEDAGAFTVPGPDQWHVVTVDFGKLPETSDNAAFALEIVSDFAPATNRYAAAGPSSSYATSGTWRFDDVELRGDAMDIPPDLPRIVAPPSGGTVSAGGALHLGVGASGAPPLAYQWERDGEALPGETGARLSRDPVAVEDAGRYRVRVINDWGEVVSDEVVVEVIPPPPPYVSFDCASLRSRLTVPDLEWPPLDVLARVDGVVITHVSLAAAGDLQFFIQDATGGLAVLWRGADAGALPPAGSRVEVIGPVRQSNGLLQIVPSASEARHAVRVLEFDTPLPDAVVFDWDWLRDPVRLESLEGRRVRVPGVTLNTQTPLFPNRGTSLTLKSASTGDSLTLRVDGDSTAARVDLAGQPKPEGAFSVTGVWTQSDSSKPYTGGYQILPTQYADLVLDGRPPSVDWRGILGHPDRPNSGSTNTFADQVLRPGESLRILATFSDDQGPIEPGTVVSLPEDVRVDWSEGSVAGDGSHLRSAEIFFTASEAHAGHLQRIVLSVVGVAAERRISWTVYVPTVEERQIAITEFFANPVSRTDSPSFNPLQRLDWPPASDTALAGRLTAWDEFVELVNLGPGPVSLAGWTLSDATRIRAWVDPAHPDNVRPAGSALVLYGGPPDSHPPRIPCPAIPAILPGGAPAGSDGLGLNNTSDRIELRNASGHLIERVVYTTRQLASDASVARWPLPDGGWSGHPVTPSGATASPGLSVLGVAWEETL